jgi:transcriptional regulator with GAF, ATPase, and Fis domain
LPEARQERDLASLYHVCFWVADGVEEKSFVERCVGLLLEAFRAEEVQLYSADQALTSAQTVDGGRSRVKLAPFLAKQFQECREATVLGGAGMARHQRGVGDFNYLVCPLRLGSLAGSAPSPFLVILRSTDQADFSAEDRVLLQAVAQLWVRGMARTNQLVELRQQNEVLKEKAGGAVMLGRSQSMLSLLAQARKAAVTQATILITGETGSGKEVLAQFLHENSPRRSGPMVKLNCAAIPDSLIESELFGYAKGAFSGAHRDHRGRFVQSHGGTLFLDEIGEMPLSVQAKVLRAIENREIQPLGSEELIKVDLRIIAATNRDLSAAVRERTFREDLYYRLDVQTLQLPPLRERTEDLAELSEHFLLRTCAENGLAAMTFAPEASAALRRHDWPGNVRELWNVVQRCALAAETLVISAPEAQAQIRRRAGGEGTTQHVHA